jgi:eukaryotic-like serine/threonine-protein kinase
MWLSGDLMHCGATCRSRGVRAGWQPVAGCGPTDGRGSRRAVACEKADKRGSAGCQTAAVQPNGSSQSAHLGKIRSFPRKDSADATVRVALKGEGPQKVCSFFEGAHPPSKGLSKLESAHLGKTRSFLRRCAANSKVRSEFGGFARRPTGNIIRRSRIVPVAEVVVSTTSGSLLLDGALQSMEVLAGFLDRFVAAWDASTAPPDLTTFLPETGEIRRLTLVELIKVDLEYRWLSRGCPKRLTEYLAEFPELAQGRIPCDLFYEEFHIRKQSGQNVTADEYLQAFPAQAAEIVSILGVEQPYESSSFHKNNDKRQRLAAIQSGESIEDFDLLIELGSGAFAKVFLARQRSMQRLVALKVATDSSDEPQTLAQLDHDHIVRVYDQRSVPEQQLRLLYMQYIAGGTLQAVIQRVRQTPPEKRSGKLILDVINESLERRGELRPSESSVRAWLAKASWPEAVCWLGAKIARALDYAHRLGVLHRDVKPANVLITPEGSPKLADFNISFSAKVAGSTPAAYFGGSLAYMSPEQLEACHPGNARAAEELDNRSDLYSLGIVLWELLTGTRPFRDETVEGGWSPTLEAMIGRRGTPVDTADLVHVPGCPDGLPPIIKTTLAADAKQRWSSGLELARRLELCTNPKACALLFPARKSFAVRLRRFTVLIVFVAAGLPNVLAGVFNYDHNLSEIIAKLGPLEPDFQLTQMVINGAAYPIGAALFWYLAFSVFRGLRRVQAGRLRSAESRPLRHRCLDLGRLTALISIVEWSIAACVYPLSLRLVRADMPPSAMLRFFFSLLLCGLVAAAYPFFVVTFFTLKSLYPVYLLADLEGASADVPLLRQVNRRNSVYLVVAALAPFLGIAALIADSQINDNVLPPGAEQSMAVFSAIGLLGLPCLFWLSHSIRADVATLSDVISSE